MATVICERFDLASNFLEKTLFAGLKRVCKAVRKDAHHNITLIGHSLTKRLPENSISEVLTSFEVEKSVWNFSNQREGSNLSATSNRSPSTMRYSSISQHVMSGKNS